MILRETVSHPFPSHLSLTLCTPSKQLISSLDGDIYCLFSRLGFRLPRNFLRSLGLLIAGLMRFRGSPLLRLNGETSLEFVLNVPKEKPVLLLDNEKLLLAGVEEFPAGPKPNPEPEPTREKPAKDEFVGLNPLAGTVPELDSEKAVDGLELAK